MMSTAIHDRDTVVARAIAIAAPEERAAYIARACGGDAALRRQVEEMVAAHFQAGGPAEKAAAAGANHAGHEGRGTRIGPYKLLDQIGEGSTGVVFTAEQQEPVQRLVALKLLKAGEDGRPVLTGLEAERQALARLDHPNIVKVFDAGTTPAGQPYFAMELITGVPLTTYCDQQQLSPRQRLELFLPVCRAVQYAHTRGIVHGALRPTNVLVATYDGQPTPRVIDFGVAGATQHLLSERPLSAACGDLIGTLEYLSPEQADPNVLDVDTRSDVYSLGVLLYELLTGTTPLPRDRLKQVTMAEALLLLRAEAPPPSTRLSESKDLQVSVPRHTAPAELIQTLRGELDAVVTKALQTDRERRYETVHELARDIQHYLADEPVEASSPGPVYRLRKWAWKCPRILAASAALLLLLLVAAVGGTSVAAWARQAEGQARREARQADDERDQARKALAEVTAQRDHAEAALRTTSTDRDQAVAVEQAAQESVQDTRAVLDFLEKTVLSAGRPKGWSGGLGKDATLRQAVDLAESKVAKTFGDRLLAEASIREALGSTYLDLEEPGRAVSQYERALALREAMLGPDAPATISCRNELATAYKLAGRSDDATQLLNKNPDSPRHAAALSVQGTDLLSKNKPADAELTLRECLAIRQRIQPNDWTTFDTQSRLGQALVEQKKYAEAERPLLDGYEGLKQRAADIPSAEKGRLTKALGRLVQLYQAWGKKDKAAKWRKELEAPHTTKNP